jgi:phosphatidylglycerophosphate synthase
MLLSSVFAFLMLVPFNNLILFGVFVFITTILDGVDGALARMTDHATEFGGFWDSTLDRISETIIFGGLLIGGAKYFVFDLSILNIAIFRLFVIFSCFGSLCISYLRARAGNDLKKDFDLDIGLFARSERLFSLFLISIIPNDLFFSIGFIILTIGIVVTAIYRFIIYTKYFAQLELNENNKELENKKE